MNNKAFTLMELMIVVLIIAILAAIALPLYNSAVDDQNNARAKAILEVINGGMERFHREYPNITVPTSNGNFIASPANNVSCNYNGENNLSADNFAAQMVACGYIPRYNYGTPVQDNNGSLNYRFALQDPSAPVFGVGYVYMEPKGNKVGNKYCRINANNVCTYMAGINQQGRASDVYHH